MKTLLTNLVIYVALAAILGCANQSWPPPTQPEPLKTTKEERKPKSPVIAKPEIVQWLWENERDRVTLTDVGWRSDGKVFDFTRIDSKQRGIFYIYREFAPNGKSLSAAEGLASKYELSTSSERWNDSAAPILTQDSVPHRSWINRTSLEKVLHELNHWLPSLVDRCLQSPLRPKIPASSFDQLGNLLINSNDLFYADRALGSVQSFIEVDWDTMAPVGVVSLFMSQAMFSFSSLGPPAPFPELRLIAGSVDGPRVEGAQNISNIGDLARFRLACVDAYHQMNRAITDEDPTADNKASTQVPRFLKNWIGSYPQISISSLILEKEHP